jgi:hypothetical protein
MAVAQILFFKMFGLFQKRSKLFILIAKNTHSLYLCTLLLFFSIRKMKGKARLSLYGFNILGLLCDIMKKTKSCLI